MNPATLIAAGVMFGSFALEFLFRRREYEKHDTIVNLACGAGYLVSAGLAGTVLALLLTAIWNATPLRWDSGSPLYWLALLLCEDCLYYWSHRASHKVRVMWVSHVVHHNSPKMNLSLGMRNSWFGGWIDWFWWVPLAALGFHPAHLAIVQAIATAWDFCCHTTWFPKSRLLDYVFNSPSNHRVHHGVEPEYVDKNFGGMLIIWDRLFGTYQAEAKTPVYGCSEMPARPKNPVYVELYLWAALIGDALKAVSQTRINPTASRSNAGSQIDGTPPTAS